MVVAVAAFKGGVGKTTTTANIASAWASAHPTSRGLLIDLDPQGNLTEAFEAHITDLGTQTAVSALTHAIENPAYRLNPAETAKLDIGVDLLPAGEWLTRVEERLTTEAGGERVLKRLLTDVGYDWVLIDTRPSDGRLTLNGVCASNYVVAVVNPARWAAEGAGKVQAFVQRVNDLGLSHSVFLGSVVNRVEGGKRVGRDQVLADLTAAGSKLLTPAVPLRAASTDGEYLGSPVVLGDAKNATATAFTRLAAALWTETSMGREVKAV